MKQVISLFICIFLLLVVFSGCSPTNLETTNSSADTSQNSSAVSSKESSSKKDTSSKQEDNQSAISSKEESSKAESTAVVSTSPVANKIIVVDAGHGINSYNKQEAIAPNSTETKIAFATGTAGKNQTEEELDLSVSLKLQKALESKGAEVHMTRTTHKSDMTNIDRAVFANKLKADISVKIHADGSENSSVNGISVLVPSNKYINDRTVIKESNSAGKSILSELVKKTGAYNRGIAVRDDLTGFNWSKVPIVLVEMGFMTNPSEDKLMETDEYQNKLVSGIVDGLEQYFE